jgi:hypothetical protein|tara:strand:- start:4369 stop:4584 length:216 start_codon:yes stop_codon:yes gene_type:complete
MYKPSKRVQELEALSPNAMELHALREAFFLLAEAQGYEDAGRDLEPCKSLASISVKANFDEQHVASTQVAP